VFSTLAGGRDRSCSTIDSMATTKAEVLEMLDAYARLPKPSGPVALSGAYLRAVAAWEELPENAAGADKSWVSRCQRDWDEHFARARAGTRG
jgi:hypothetical protein